MRQSLLNRAFHILYPASRARRGIAAVLASACSVSLLAAGTATLSVMAGPGIAWAAGTPVAYSLPGEIVVWAPAGVDATRVAQLAGNAGCEVVANIAAPSPYYLLRLKATTRSARVFRSRATAAPITPPRLDKAPSAGVLAAIQTLKSSQPGLIADPNYVAFPTRGRAPKPALFQDGGIVTVTPNDTYFSQQWDMRMINMPSAWAYQTNIQTSIVADIDTGFDVGHPDFERSGVRNYLDPINVATPGSVTSDVASKDGHGVHTAGTIAAVSNNNTGIAGVAGYNGGNVNVKLLPIKASITVKDDDDNDVEIFPIDAEIAALLEATRRGAKAINMSLGGFGRSDAEAVAIESVNNAGVVICASMGNEGIDTTIFPTYPANFPGVVGVSAVANTGTLASYSNFGGNTTITAPGGDFNDPAHPELSRVLSTFPRNLPSELVTGYTYEQGTSMSCPHVTGVAALLVAAGANREKVISTLISTATPIPGTNSKLFYGAGLLNAGAAVLAVADPDPNFTLLGGETLSNQSGDPSVTAISDKGSSYFHDLQFQLQLIGVTKLINSINANPNTTSLRLSIETATTPSSVVQSFTIPADQIPSLASGELKATTKSLTVPSTPVRLTQGRYKAVVTLTYGGTNISQIQYFEVLDQVQPIGLTLFSIPFQPAATVSGISKEEQVLGLSSNFSLNRFNPLPVVNPATGAIIKSPGYVTYQPPTTDEIDARFSNLTFIADPLHLDRALVPLSYDVSNPRVSLAPIGVGYWLNLGEQRTIATTGTPATNSVGIPMFGLEDDQGNSRGISGWNLIGAPFPYPVNWSAVSIRVQSPIGIRDYSLSEAIAAELIGPALVAYDPQVRSYVYSVAPAGQLLPFHGYWVRAMRDVTLIVPPNRSGQSSTRAVKTGITTTSTGNQLPAMDGWRVRLAASVAGDRDAENYLGQVRGASDGEDRFDIAKPPSGPSHAYVRFLNNDKKGRKTAFAFDMRSSESKRKKEEWTVAVGADKGNTDVTITWDGLGGLPNRSRLSLKDSVTGTVIPMNSRSSYTYRNTEAGATRMFTVTMTPQASSGPLQIMNVRTTNTGGRGVSRSMNVEFATSQDAEIQATVQTLSGKVVSVLNGPSRSADQSKITMRWDLRSREGSEVASGPYILEITARTDSGETATIKRPIAILR